MNPRLEEIIAELDPDVICEDNVPAFPALAASGRPWVRIASCNPLEIRDPAIPPVFSGYAAGDGRAGPSSGPSTTARHRDMWAEFDAFVQAAGAPPLPDLEFIHASPYLNLYVYPAEADYSRRHPLDQTWHRVESCVRGSDGAFEIPEGLRGGEGGLVYLSLGSLGSADVDLMKRLVDVLGRTKHRYIVSKGPQHDQYEVAENMWGEEFVPQPSVLPQVDLVITHGGNNTTTECFHFGKPMIALPLFWDQYDNAQRIDETGFGVRLDDIRVRRGGDGGRDRPTAGRRRPAPAHGGDRDAARGRPRHGAGGRPHRACRCRRRGRGRRPLVRGQGRGRSGGSRSATGSTWAGAPRFSSLRVDGADPTSGARATPRRPSSNRGLTPNAGVAVPSTPA